jgi:hypothetical protein
MTGWGCQGRQRLHRSCGQHLIASRVPVPPRLPWALLLVIPVLAMLFYAHLAEVAHPAIRSAMLNEAGTPYVVVSFISPLLVAAFVGVGLYLRVRRAHTAR